MKSAGFHMKSTWNLVDFMKSGGFQVKSSGFHEIWQISWNPADFTMKSGRFHHEIRWISCEIHPNWRVFAETSEFIRFWVDFTWNPPDFMVKSAGFHGEICRISWIMSFCVMIKYRSFDFRKTKHTVTHMLATLGKIKMEIAELLWKALSSFLDQVDWRVITVILQLLLTYSRIWYSEIYVNHTK